MNNYKISSYSFSLKPKAHKLGAYIGIGITTYKTTQNKQKNKNSKDRTKTKSQKSTCHFFKNYNIQVYKK